MPPPPPPPPGLPPPPLAAPRAQAAAAGSGNLFAELAAKRPEEPAIIPQRPRTPPPPMPEVFCDVKVDWIPPMALYNKLQFGSQLLVIDLRANEEFDACHVRSSICVDMKKFEGISDVLAIEEKVDQRFQYRRMFHVVIYDQSSKSNSPSPLMQDTIRKLQEERRCAAGVSVLDGGYDAMFAKYPFLIKGTSVFVDHEFPSEIMEGFLYLGSWNSAGNDEVLRQLNIKHVINATDTCDMPFQSEFKYLQCPMDDNPKADMGQFFQQVIEYVTKAEANNERVFIHCQMGMSRSSSLVILYLMYRYKVSLKEATDMCRRERPFINPNPGFLKQLSDFELKLLGKTTIRFPENEPITFTTEFEWQHPDGSWHKHIVVR